MRRILDVRDENSLDDTLDALVRPDSTTYRGGGVTTSKKNKAGVPPTPRGSTTASAPTFSSSVSREYHHELHTANHPRPRSDPMLRSVRSRTHHRGGPYSYPFERPRYGVVVVVDDDDDDVAFRCNNIIMGSAAIIPRTGGGAAAALEKRTNARVLISALTAPRT